MHSVVSYYIGLSQCTVQNAYGTLNVIDKDHDKCFELAIIYRYCQITQQFGISLTTF
jgi:hypothetical protein